jgi:hypothetical protein
MGSYVYYTFQTGLRPMSRSVPAWNRYQAIQMLLSIALATVDLVMAAAAIDVWRRNRGHRLLRTCLWIWLAVLLLATLHYVLMFQPGTGIILASFTLHSLVTAAFPVLMLLVLREYSRERCD